MNPLRSHHGNAGLSSSSDIGNIFRDLHTLIKGKMDSIARTGPAKDHHKKAILPTHNIFKPGAHPSQKKDDKKKDDHKKDHDINQHKKGEKTADELRARLKPVRIE